MGSLATGSLEQPERNETVVDDIFAYLQATRETRVGQLIGYLRFPSISNDPKRLDAVQQCAAFTADILKRAGMDEVTIHQTPGHPVVLGSCHRWPERPTLLIYGHFDVQPVDPIDRWDHDPFTPVIHNDRIYARGAADDKGQILMHIQAAAAILKLRGELPVNLIFLIEGEEEIGSPNLTPFLEAHRHQLQADLVVISDSGMWNTETPAITTHLRGLTALEVTVTGPNRDLHSGCYGGAIANPIEILARMLASVKDDQGNIQIPGFFDAITPVDETVRQRFAALPFDESKYLQELGLNSGWGETGYTCQERTWLRPTFEINGMWGGFNGSGIKTVLPSQAHAKISLRLVPDQDPQEMAALVSRYLSDIAPPTVTVQIKQLPGGGRAAAVPFDLPALAVAQRALAESFPCKPILIGEGGSIPVVADFKKFLGVHSLLVGFSLPDARPHSANENFHLPTFHRGIESLVRLYHYL